MRSVPGGRRQARRRSASMMRKLIGIYQDRPLVIAVGLAVVVTVHAVLGLTWASGLVPYSALAQEVNNSISVTLYLGAAAASAIVAGFAGVIIVFTIGSGLPRLQRFRYAAGDKLGRNWIIVVAEPLAAALLGIVSSVVQMTDARLLAPWLFEFGVVLLIEGAFRLVWILKELVQIVGASDIDAEREQRKTPLKEIFGGE